MHRISSVADKMTTKTERHKVTMERGDKWEDMEGREEEGEMEEDTEGREEEPLHEAVKRKPGLHLETSGRGTDAMGGLSVRLVQRK